ncbi:hypothetical protein AAC387_Pa02g0652 [Persea americana]
MGVYRHWLGDPASIGLFRETYKIPANVEVRPDGPDDGISYSNGWMPFWLVSVVEGGIRFPLHPLLRDCLREWELSPCQLLPNGYKIIMGVVRLNEILAINLGVPDIEEAYDLCKSAEGNTYYLRLRVCGTTFVTALEDSNKYAGEDRVFVRGAWEFGEAESSTTARIPRRIGVPPNFRQRRELARRNLQKVNTDWHEKVRKYCGHHCGAAWSLLGYTPHYQSFTTSRRVTGIDSVLHGESLSSEPVQTEVPISETVTFTIPSGLPVESGDQAPDREPAGTARAEAVRTWQRKKFVVSSASRSSSSSEETKVEMLRRRGQRFMAENLSAAAFRDIGGETLDPFQAASVAPTTTSIVAAEETLAPAAEVGPGAVAEAEAGPSTLAEAGPSTAAEVGPELPAIVVEDSPSDSVGRGGPAEVVEACRPEKRARVELPPALASPLPVGETATPSQFVPWRPDIEGVLGRQLAESDRAVNLEVVAALGRACALPQDMGRWARMDNESLLLSSMRSLGAVCNLIPLIPVFFFSSAFFWLTLFLSAALTKMPDWHGEAGCSQGQGSCLGAEKEEQLKSLAAKDATLAEEASRNADLFADLDAARALAEHLKEKAKKEADQNVHLSFELDEVRLALSRQEEDMQMLRGTNKRLTSERRLAERELEMARKGKAVKLNCRESEIGLGYLGGRRP